MIPTPLDHLRHMQMLRANIPNNPYNVFDASQALDKNVWKTMTDELVPVLQGTATIQEALIITMEDDTQ